MLEPITPWEQDLWPVFDRLKSAIDRQDDARVAGKLDDFVRSAKILFLFLETLTRKAWEWDSVQTEWVYLAWKHSRGIDQWVPDRDLPLRWYVAEQAMLPLPQDAALAKIKEKHAGWAQSCKDAAKTVKAEHRKREREHKKAEKAKAKEKTDGVVRTRG